MEREKRQRMVERGKGFRVHVAFGHFVSRFFWWFLDDKQKDRDSGGVCVRVGVGYICHELCILLESA